MNQAFIKLKHCADRTRQWDTWFPHLLFTNQRVLQRSKTFYLWVVEYVLAFWLPTFTKELWEEPALVPHGSHELAENSQQKISKCLQERQPNKTNSETLSRKWRQTQTLFQKYWGGRNLFERAEAQQQIKLQSYDVAVFWISVRQFQVGLDGVMGCSEHMTLQGPKHHSGSQST